MSPLTTRRLALSEPIWFRTYGIVLNILGLAWLITFVIVSHGFHRNELWPGAGLITAGTGLLSRERWRIVCSSAVLAITALLIDVLLLHSPSSINLLIALGVTAFSLTPTILCIHQWRNLA